MLVEQVTKSTGLSPSDAWSVTTDQSAWRALRPVDSQAYRERERERERERKSWPTAFVTYPAPICDLNEGNSREIPGWYGKARMTGPQSGEGLIIIASAVWAQHINLTDTHTDTRTCRQSNCRSNALHQATIIYHNHTRGWSTFG